MQNTRYTSFRSITLIMSVLVSLTAGYVLGKWINKFDGLYEIKSYSPTAKMRRICSHDLGCMGIEKIEEVHHETEESQY